MIILEKNLLAVKKLRKVAIKEQKRKDVALRKEEIKKVVQKNNLI